jgi:hypothetical protein
LLASRPCTYGIQPFLKLGLNRLRHSDRVTILLPRLMPSVHFPKCIAQAHMRHGDSRRQLLRCLRFCERFLRMFFSAQLPGTHRIIQCSHSWNVEASFEHKDSVLDHRRRTNVLKSLVRIQLAAAKFEAGKSDWRSPAPAHRFCQEHPPSADSRKSCWLATACRESRNSWNRPRRRHTTRTSSS